MRQQQDSGRQQGNCLAQSQYCCGPMQKETLDRRRLTALQKNVRYDFPTVANAANTNPNSPWVERRAMFSTNVRAFNASARCHDGHISVMTPLAAGAVPEANGRRKVAAFCQCPSID